MPNNRNEKNMLKQMIVDSPTEDENGIKHLEENFKEAIRYINTCVTPTKIPCYVETMLNDKNCTNLNGNSSAFWILCAALREFVQSEGCLPLRGSLPDMAADTNSYVTLQKLYHTQAQAHAEAVYRRALQITHNLGLSQEYISQSEVISLLLKFSERLRNIGRAMRQSILTKNEGVKSAVTIAALFDL